MNIGGDLASIRATRYVYIQVVGCDVVERGVLVLAGNSTPSLRDVVAKVEDY